MPGRNMPVELTRIVAEYGRRLTRLERATRTPAGAQGARSLNVQAEVGGGAGSMDLPELDVGGVWETLIPVIGISGAGGTMSVKISNVSGNGYDVFAATLHVVDPISGSDGYASGTLSPVPGSGAWDPTWSSSGGSGAAFSFTGGFWTRVSAGPVVGWCDLAFTRTS